ncbi:MAG: metal-dependent hydrolase, partial [Thermomicrobiaceae bacterium]|nr:metal-dependent hydrolase [Thermomicrobiaceae bacterium]
MKRSPDRTPARRLSLVESSSLPQPTPPRQPLRAAVLSAVGSLAVAALTAAWHRRWAIAPDGTPRRGLFDGLCHAGTALAVTLPALPYVRDPARVLRVAVTSALLIDLDHVVAARSVRLRRCMTMDQRPASHSALTPLAGAVLVEWLRPNEHLGMGVLLGLASHLLRDLGTGGAPLLHPRRVVSIPNA